MNLQNSAGYQKSQIYCLDYSYVSPEQTYCPTPSNWRSSPNSPSVTLFLAPMSVCGSHNQV